MISALRDLCGLCGETFRSLPLHHPHPRRWNV